jgi:hypothetical protein
MQCLVAAKVLEKTRLIIASFAASAVLTISFGRTYENVTLASGQAQELPAKVPKCSTQWPAGQVREPKSKGQWPHFASVSSAIAFSELL